jgi:hypothetical protein
MLTELEQVSQSEDVVKTQITTVRDKKSMHGKPRTAAYLDT